MSSIRAPRKAFALIERGGRFGVLMQADAFLKDLIAVVLPVVKRR